jgi:hypothetical protein
VIVAIQAWLSETPAQKKNATTPAVFSVLMSRESPDWLSPLDSEHG